jgi:predicted membrane-bound mannosyltransferase
MRSDSSEVEKEVEAVILSASALFTRLWNLGSKVPTICSIHVYI